MDDEYYYNYLEKYYLINYINYLGGMKNER